MSDSDGAKKHDSRAASEKDGYDRLRREGITPDHARRISREASETLHRNLDKGKNR